jgi:pimeloyl-ACP methyl ester carboxylesterase
MMVHVMLMRLVRSMSRLLRPSAPSVLAVLCVAGLCALGLGGPTGTSAGTSVGAPRLAKAALPASCGGKGNRCQEQVALPGGSTLTVFRNVPLSGSATVTHALVVVHGAGRDPVATFTGMMTATAKAGVSDSTMVVAPWFKTNGDHPGKREASWTDDGWKQGDAAVRPAGLSSFTVMDDLLTTLASKSRFPKLNWITVVGHSAGGQFVQRYAVFGLASNRLPGVAFNYVAANPSSYVYFGPARPSGTGFVIPTKGSCKDYDTYKYGMVGRQGYVAALTPQQALANYAGRRVTILNGGADTFDNGDLDTRCGAMLEGTNREVRGANYLDYMHQLAPGAAHDRIVVPGVDHNHYALFESPLAAPVLFGTRQMVGTAIPTT